MAAPATPAPLLPSRSDKDIPEEIRRLEPQRCEDVHMAVLHRCADFLVVDKPADVRLDGDFSVTVEKLCHIAAPDAEKFWFAHRLDYGEPRVLAEAAAGDTM
jgi:23S rRNA-/tRNA-specific pseudouridylate synthase